MKCARKSKPWPDVDKSLASTVALENIEVIGPTINKWNKHDESAVVEIKIESKGPAVFVFGGAAYDTEKRWAFDEMIDWIQLSVWGGRRRYLAVAEALEAAAKMLREAESALDSACQRRRGGRY